MRKMKEEDPSRIDRMPEFADPFPPEGPDEAPPKGAEGEGPDAVKPDRLTIADHGKRYRERIAVLPPEERREVYAERNAKRVEARKRNQNLVERAETMMNCVIRGKAADRVRELYPELGNDIYFMDAALAGLLAKLPKGDVGAWGIVLRLFGEDKLRITGLEENVRREMKITFVDAPKPVIDLVPSSQQEEGGDAPQGAEDAEKES